MTSSKFPIGFKFEPTNYEIITTFLVPKLKGLPTDFGDAIVEEQIYELNPDSLNWNHVHCLNDYERYYFVKRTPIMASEEKKKAKNAKRVLKSGEGFWKIARSDPILDSQGRYVGDVAILNFYVYKDNLTKTKDNGLKTEFIMHEFTIRGESFQEWVICRIKDKEKEKNNLSYPIKYEDHDNEMLEESANEEVEEILQQDEEVEQNPTVDNSNKLDQNTVQRQEEFQDQEDDTILQWLFEDYMFEFEDQDQVAMPQFLNDETLLHQEMTDFDIEATLAQSPLYNYMTKDSLF